MRSDSLARVCPVGEPVSQPLSSSSTDSLSFSMSECRTLGRVKKPCRAARALKAVTSVVWPGKGAAAASDAALDAGDIAIIATRSGWHVAAASQPRSWEPAPSAAAVLLLLSTRERAAAMACMAGLRAQPRPVVALLLDVGAHGAGDVERALECQRDLAACGVDDVLANVATEAALELAISMSKLRCAITRSCTRHVAEEEDSDADSLFLSELSWCLPAGSDSEAAAVEKKVRPKRRSVAECGTNTDMTMHAAGLRCMRCSKPAPAPTQADFAAAARPQPGAETDAAARDRGRGASVGRRSEDRRPVPGAPRPPRPSPLDGTWVAKGVRGGDGAFLPSPWLSRIRVSGPDVVLADNSRTRIEEKGGRLRLCGGELQLIGSTLVRRGRGGVDIEFQRVPS